MSIAAILKSCSALTAHETTQSLRVAHFASLLLNVTAKFLLSIFFVLKSECFLFLLIKALCSNRNRMTKPRENSIF